MSIVSNHYPEVIDELNDNIPNPPSDEEMLAMAACLGELQVVKDETETAQESALVF